MRSYPRLCHVVTNFSLKAGWLAGRLHGWWAGGLIEGVMKVVFWWQAIRYVHCPTCRQKAPVRDIAYVDAGRTAATEADGASSAQHEEEQLHVRGSYSTKVRA